MTDLSADYKALADYRPTHKVRFVTAASLFDGHDAAINIMRRILQGMGAEVIHLGHNRSVDEVVTAALTQQFDHVLEVLDMTALVAADGDTLRVFLQRRGHHFIHRSVVPQVNHFGAHALQDAAHDVDGRVVAVEQRSSGDEANLVFRAVFGKGLVFGGQVGHGGLGGWRSLRLSAFARLCRSAFMVFPSLCTAIVWPLPDRLAPLEHLRPAARQA